MKYIEQYEVSSELKTKLQNNFHDVHPCGPVGDILFVQGQQVRCLFKQSKSGDKAEMLIHAAMGISGESGELLDAVKKHVFYERELNMENMVEELGDILFYVHATCQVLGIAIEDVMAANISKLNKRYPSGTFSNEQANARADKMEEDSEPLNKRTVVNGHVLYMSGDLDAPDSIKDRNGEVVLGLCMLCGKGEIELEQPCGMAAKIAETASLNNVVTAEEEAAAHPIMTSRHLK